MTNKNQLTKPKKRFTIAIADDHPLIIAGLRAVLARNFEVTGISSNGRELLNLVAVRQPDLVLIDLNMPLMDGKEAAARLCRLYPDLKCVILSSIYDPGSLPELKKMGVRAYLNKQIHPETLIRQLKQVAAGELVFEYDLGQTSPHWDTGIPLRSGSISDRELEIIRMVRKGHTSRDIGDKLFISIATVETHRKNIYKKLGFNSVPALIRYANEHLL